MDYKEEVFLQILFHPTSQRKDYFRPDLETKTESDTVVLVDEENSNTKMKKSSLEFESRTRKFVAASAAVYI